MLGVFSVHALHEASAATACKFVLCEIRQHAAAASAAALHLFGFHADLETSAARACEYILSEVGQRAADASAAAFSCKNPVILMGNEKSEFLWSCSGLLVFLQWCVAGKSGKLEFVDNFSQFGKGRGKRFSLPKMSSKHDDLQASAPEDPGNFVISRVGMGTASTVARPWVRGRRQDGWTSPSMLSRLPSAMWMSLRYTGLRSVSSS